MHTRTHMSRLHQVSGYMWRHPRAHIHALSHIHVDTHTRVDRHVHVHMDSHTRTHMYTQSLTSGDLRLRSDTHTAQEAMVGRLRPGWHLGEKRVQVKDLSPLRGSRERVCREVEASRGGRGDGAAQTGARGYLTPRQAAPDPGTERGTSAHGRPRGTPGQSRDLRAGVPGQCWRSR